MNKQAALKAIRSSSRRMGEYREFRHLCEVARAAGATLDEVEYQINAAFAEKAAIGLLIVLLIAGIAALFRS